MRIVYTYSHQKTTYDSFAIRILYRDHFIRSVHNISSVFYLFVLMSIGISLVYILQTYFPKSTINLVLAAGTAEGKASNQITEMQGFFSPIGPKFSKQLPKESRGETISLFPQHLIQVGSPVQGNLSAPITIIEFGDFQCGFCDRFAKETEPKINETYIQTGKVNMIFKNFVTHGPDSNTAAIAAQCANDQGKFWNFYNILYKNQGEENSGWASANNLKKLSLQVPGLNAQKFNVCLDGNKYKSLSERDNTLAISSGLQGTPSFVIEKRD